MCVAVLKTLDEFGFGCRRDGDELIARGFFQLGDKDSASIECIRGEARAPMQGSKDFLRYLARPSGEGKRHNRQRARYNNRRGRGDQIWMGH